jgi:pyrroloquinoline-quinone synthase
VNFWTSLAGLRASNDVLHHPFYRRWSAGELTRSELAHYAGQYRHAVVALADATARVAATDDATVDDDLRAELEAHARDEASHVALWDEFAHAVGGSPSAPAAPATARCARTWAGGDERPLLRSLVALHAIEAAQPAIARTKRAGLLAHYGIDEGPATAYFELHEHLDVEHAAHSRELISARLDAAGASAPAAEDRLEALLDEASRVLRANWLLLDGVERFARRSHVTA